MANACRSASPGGMDSEEEWQNKLRENAGFDDFESYAADWDRYISLSHIHQDS